MTRHNILLGLTTTKNSNWRQKVEEIKQHNLKSVALFLTGIDKQKRKELYELLETTNVKFIPHVHLRNDQDEKEMQYLIDRYKVKVFNIHPDGGAYGFHNFPEKFKHMTCKENVGNIPTVKELRGWGGVCIDFSHWEYYGFYKIFGYRRKFKIIVNEFKTMCSHISAVKYIFGLFPKTAHQASSEKDFNYLKKYKKYLPEYLSLELENSFKEQLKYKKYIEGLINLN